MELECASGFFVDQATEQDIEKVFADNRCRGEFVILSQSEQKFLQASGVYDGPFLLEYRDGDARYLFQGRRELTKVETERFFIKYFRGDPAWKKELEWNVQEEKPWWKFW